MFSVGEKILETGRTGQQNSSICNLHYHVMYTYAEPADE